MTTRTPVLRSLTLLLVVASLLLTACGNKDGGPDLIAVVDAIPGSTGTPPSASTGSGSDTTSDPLEGATRRSYFRGDVNSVARTIRNRAGEPAESITEDGVVHYLYRSGTVIIADIDGTTGVGLVENRRARRNRPFLMSSGSWNRQVNDFGSSGGNGFRGGGSGSGK